MHDNFRFKTAWNASSETKHYFIAKESKSMEKRNWPSSSIMGSAFAPLLPRVPPFWIERGEERMPHLFPTQWRLQGRKLVYIHSSYYCKCKRATKSRKKGCVKVKRNCVCIPLKTFSFFPPLLRAWPKDLQRLRVEFNLSQRRQRRRYHYPLLSLAGLSSPSSPVPLVSARLSASESKSWDGGKVPLRRYMAKWGWKGMIIKGRERRRKLQSWGGWR